MLLHIGHKLNHVLNKPTVSTIIIMYLTVITSSRSALKYFQTLFNDCLAILTNRNKVIDGVTSLDRIIVGLPLI